jgi:predicted DCC family thiol-disulfide oxidoreductase YuxK
MSAPRPQGSTRPSGQHLVLYDGVCGLCNRLNAFLLPRDACGVFVFAPIQSRTGQTLLKRFGKTTAEMNTFYIVMNHRAESPVLLVKSRAALFVLTMLGGPWRWLALFGVLPARLLDVGYDLIARNRHRFFGRYEHCLMPATRFESRFIDL